MKLIAILIFVFYTGNDLLYSSKPIKYENELSPDYNQALNYLRKNEGLFNRCLGRDTDKKAILVSVIFPEIVRYLRIRDLMETKSLEIGYVSRGSKFIDFSIGRFQMKPSFFESIEGTIKKSDSLRNKYHRIIHYLIPGEADVQAIRKKRLERLKSVEWQLLYIQAFFDITIGRHPFLRQESMEYRIGFVATAYNHNFLADKDEIEDWMTHKTYPWGTKVKGEQYNYSQVSHYFFINHYHSVF